MDRERMFKLFDIGRNAIEQHDLNSVLLRADDMKVDVWVGSCGIVAFGFTDAEMGDTYDWNGKEWVRWPL